jgi:hypothetical protein
MTEATTTAHQRSIASDQWEPIQLLRPAGDCYEARELLERPNLTAQEVTTFLRGETLLPRQQTSWRAKHEALLRAYNARRDEIRDLVSRLDTGGSSIDEHGRLVPVEQQHNPLQAPLVAQQQQHAQHRPLNPPLPPLPPRNNLQNLNDNNNNNGAGDDDDAERRRLEQEEREAAEAIARAVQRYRNAGVPEDEFVLLRVPPSHQQQQQLMGVGGVNNQNVRLTFRRICFAVLAVSTAFFCIMLQTLPLFRPIKMPNPTFDKLMYELLNVRHFDVHARHCSKLHRRMTVRWDDWVWKVRVLQLLRRCHRVRLILLIS